MVKNKLYEAAKLLKKNCVTDRTTCSYCQFEVEGRCGLRGLPGDWRLVDPMTVQPE